MTDLKQSDKSFTYRLIQILELNSLELNLMNGNVSGKLRQSLSSREVAKTKLREESRKLDKGLNDLCTLLFWSLEQTKFLGMLELQFSIWTSFRLRWSLGKKCVLKQVP